MSDMVPTDELVGILTRHRDHEFARWFLFAFALAAEQYPEEVRKAVGTAFSVKAVETELERMGRLFAVTQAHMNEARAEVQDARDECVELQKQMAVLRDEFALLRDRCLKMQRWLDEKAKAVVDNTPQRRHRRPKEDT